MNTHADKSHDNKNQSVANTISQKQGGGESTFQFTDNRPETVTQRKLQEMAGNSLQTKQTTQLETIAETNPIQRLTKSNVIQLAGVWDEVNVGFGSKTDLDPETFAQGLTEGSEEFAALRESANEQTQEHFGEDLKYKPKPKKGGGTSEAYFKDDSAYFNMEGHPAMILSNLIFETANAAQTGSFIQVESDYKSGAIMKKSPKDYGFEDLGDKLTQEYEKGDGETRRSIIQERFEWNSFILAKPSFLKVKGEMKKQEKSKEMYSIYFAAFDHMLTMSTFEEYYNEYGHIHRNAVEGVLRKVAEQEKNKSKCYLTTACVEAKGLPDNCEELTTLRDFRDTYLKKKENGSSLIATYYKYSPQIVSVIKSRKDEEEILAWLYKVIRQCVEAIKRGDNEIAYHIYCKMVVALKDIYLPEVEVPNPYLVNTSL